MWVVTDGTHADLQFSINGKWVEAEPVHVVFGMGKPVYWGVSLLSENAKVRRFSLLLL